LPQLLTTQGILSTHIFILCPPLVRGSSFSASSSAAGGNGRPGKYNSTACVPDKGWAETETSGVWF